MIFCVSYEQKLKFFDQEFTKQDKIFHKNKQNFEKAVDSAANLEISESTGKVLDEECTKVFGKVYKTNQENMEKVNFNEINTK